MLTPLINYLKGLIDTKNPADAKSFVGILSFAYVLLCGIVDLFTPLTPSSEIFFGILGLVIAVFGLNTYISQKAMSIKGDVASDMVNKEPSQESANNAKDVLKQDKPS